MERRKGKEGSKKRRGERKNREERSKNMRGELMTGESRQVDKRRGRERGREETKEFIALHCRQRAEACMADGGWWARRDTACFFVLLEKTRI